MATGEKSPLNKWKICNSFGTLLVFFCHSTSIDYKTFLVSSWLELLNFIANERYEAARK